jgi:putative methanogenesis marker protein 17
MAGLEYFEVESTEPNGGAAYKEIVSDVLLDHNLVRVIEKLHIYIDPEIPIFIAVGVLKKLPTEVRLRDFSSVTVEGNTATIAIGDETYLAPLLDILWERYGKPAVDQPDRFNITITADQPIDPDLQDLVVKDPSETLFKDLIYAMTAIAPEGFKVRRQRYGGDRFSYVASENTLETPADALLAEQWKKMGEHP